MDSALQSTHQTVHLPFLAVLVLQGDKGQAATPCQPKGSHFSHLSHQHTWSR